MIRFALDEGFPDTIIEALTIGVAEAELLPLRKINKRLLQMDDWRLILSLHLLGGFDGLVTTDANILNFPRSLAVIHQTHFTAVITERSGHDPVRAAGLLLVHLPGICRKMNRRVGQIWRLSAQTKNHEDPWAQLKRVADHQNTKVNDLFHASKLSAKQLKQNPLDELPLEATPPLPSSKRL